MMTKWRLSIVGGGLGLYLVGLGLLGGLGAALNWYDKAVRQSHASLGQVEPPVPAEPEARDAAWTGHLQRVEEALAEKNVSAAELAWHDAYGAALRSRRWEGLLEVGDTALRIGEVAKDRKASEVKARQIYLAALFRARNEGSLDGVLRAAEAFIALGDREVAAQGLRIAERLAALPRDAQVRDRVRALKDRLAAPSVSAESHGLDLF